MISKAVYCSGTYQEIGKQEGRILAPEINENLMNFWNTIASKGYRKSELIKNASKQGI